MQVDIVNYRGLDIVEMVSAITCIVVTRSKLLIISGIYIDGKLDQAELYLVES